MRIQDLNFDDPAFIRDPYPAFEQLRREEPAGFHPGLDAWIFTRHADIQVVLRDNRFGRAPGIGSGHGYPPAFARFHQNTFMEMDPPEHTRLRALVSKVFTPGRVESLAPSIQAQADSLLEAWPEGSPVDFISMAASPLPVAIIAGLLGIPPADRHLLQPWSHAIVAMYEVTGSPETRLRAEAAVVEFWEYLRQHLAALRRSPGQDLVSSLAAQPDLKEDEVIATAILLLNAGHEATVNAASNGMYALLSQPEAWQHLRETPELARTAIEEMLRYDTPLQFFRRYALQDVETAGCTILEGQSAGLLFGSANRDEAVFKDAGWFDLARRPNPHITFGSGIHYCLGAPLARLELHTLLAALLKRFSFLEIAREPAYKPGFVMRGLQELYLVGKAG